MLGSYSGELLKFVKRRAVWVAAGCGLRCYSLSPSCFRTSRTGPPPIRSSPPVSSSHSCQLSFPDMPSPGRHSAVVRGRAQSTIGLAVISWPSMTSRERR